MIEKQKKMNMQGEVSISHFKIENNDKITLQSNEEHLNNVAKIAMSLSEISELKDMAWCAGIFHDVGKYHEDFQEYINKAINCERVNRGSVDHATAGGYFLQNHMADFSNFLQFLQYSIYSHHGLQDCFKMNNNKSLFTIRSEKGKVYKCIEDKVYKFLEKKDIQNKIELAKKGYDVIVQKLAKILENSENTTDVNPLYYYGMYERMLLSLLIDADRIDTFNFMNGIDTNALNSYPCKNNKIWKECQNNFNCYMEKFQEKSDINKIRDAISKHCEINAKSSEMLYRLSVPTGGGKTLSSLHFAIEKAIHENKSRIIYVSPFCTLLDQNAEVIRKAVGNKNYVLEHHSNVIFENDKDEYNALISNWDVPIVATTFVQLMNTLYDSRTSSIRKMHNLSNAVIIFDEVQAVPMRLTLLFNMAINFLTEFAKSTVVLCSATQPPFEEIVYRRMFKPKEIIPTEIIEDQVFRRVDIQDKTKLNDTSLNLEEFADYIEETACREGQLLVVVNTKSCARDVYLKVKERFEFNNEVFEIYHISTNMCLKNRLEKLDDLTRDLNENRKVICISTTVIEAGVDLSFKCGIRSLTGLDHIIQTAGRVNRNATSKDAKLYIVKLSDDLESNKIFDNEKQKMQQLLWKYNKGNEKYNNRIDSKKMINEYYRSYFAACKDEMNYNVSINGYTDSLVNMFSGIGKLENDNGIKNLLRHAFKTAGDKFEVINDDGNTDVIVQYDECAIKAIDILSNQKSSYQDKKDSLQVLQAYTVSISNTLKQEINDLIYTKCDGSLLILKDGQYDKEYGVCGGERKLTNLIID